MASIFELTREDFMAALPEMAQQGVDTDNLLRQYRAANSPFSAINRAAEASSAGLAATGRRPVAGGLLSKPAGATGMDALRGLKSNLGGGLLGVLAGAGQTVDAPMAAYQGLIPQSDMPLEALGTAGAAMVGGGAVTRPAGSLGMGGRESNFGKDWQDAYHWTRSQEPFEEFDPDKSTSAMSQIGPHVGTRSAAEARTLAFPNETGTMMSLKANIEKPFLNPRTNEPWSEIGLESFISSFADEHGIERRSAAPVLRRMLADEGYTDIPYINDIEDAGSISNIMLVDRPSGSDAVLRRSDAAFDPSRRTDPNLLAANASSEVGLLSAAAARTPAEQMARQILDMRAAGRAGDVTDEMMAQADPQYMFANTPLPMDEASRVARAGEMGFDTNVPLYHGTGTDFQSFDASRFGQSDHGAKGRGVYTSQNPDLASSYATLVPESGRQVYPLSYGLRNPYAGEIPMSMYDEGRSVAFTQQLKDAGFDGVMRPNSRRGGEYTEAVAFEPANIRSRFARFDPEFAHLSNLNAANIDPLSGLFSAMAAEEQRRQRNATP